MATSTSQLQLRLAYRMGENSAPSDANEKGRRLQYLNEGKREVFKKFYFWFTQGTKTLISTANQEIYTMPSDVRDVIDLRVDRKMCVFQPQHEVAQQYRFPATNYYDSSVPRWSLFGTDELHIQPAPSSTPTLLSVSSLTRSGSVATAVTTTAHGLRAGDYVNIAGANESGYNGDFRIVSVPGATSFTFAVSGTPSTPASGTITAQWRNIVIRSWLLPTEMDDNTSDCGIPDMFTGCLDAYAYARLQQKKGKRGSAADGFDEFNEYITEMISEHNKRMLYAKQVQPMNPNWMVNQ